MYDVLRKKLCWKFCCMALTLKIVVCTRIYFKHSWDTLYNNYVNCCRAAMRLFKRRSSDPSPLLVSLSPFSADTTTTDVQVSSQDATTTKSSTKTDLFVKMQFSCLQYLLCRSRHLGKESVQQVG